jgi:hypothetical protein
MIRYAIYLALVAAVVILTLLFARVHVVTCMEQLGVQMTPAERAAMPEECRDLTWMQ